MSNDIPWAHPLPSVSEPQKAIQTVLLGLLDPSEPPSQALTRRGRPFRLSDAFLSWVLLWCVLNGWVSQLDLWRRVSRPGLPGFVPVSVCDQASTIGWQDTGSRSCRRCVHRSVNGFLTPQLLLKIEPWLPLPVRLSPWMKVCSIQDIVGSPIYAASQPDPRRCWLVACPIFLIYDHTDHDTINLS
jgi:hypothetical protein